MKGAKSDSGVRDSTGGSGAGSAGAPCAAAAAGAGGAAPGAGGAASRSADLARVLRRDQRGHDDGDKRSQSASTQAIHNFITTPSRYSILCLPAIAIAPGVDAALELVEPKKTARSAIALLGQRVQVPPAPP